MKVCILQPPYSRGTRFADWFFAEKLRLLEECDGSVDLIVLPEYSDVPCGTSTLEETLFYHEKYISILLEKCVATARRCNAIVCVNTLSREETGWRNATYVYDRTGTLAGKYFKRHLPPLEAEVLKLDGSYADDFSPPCVLELEGLRYAFLTCYDFYFYEAFPTIARQNVDLIIGCSLQRSDSHEATEIMCRFLAYNTNAYVIRSSVSFGEQSQVCGASMVVSPKGEVLTNMRSRIGRAEVEFDPREKYYKPAGFGNPPAAHYEYMEYGRRPWLYRPAGPAMSLPESRLPYPRICAHRGFSAVAPENSMPAFGAAVALGAEEIELDVWATADGVLVSCHDDTLERVSDGSGKIYEKTYAELQALDFGAKTGASFAGLRIPTLEEVLQKFSCQTVINLHVKIWDYQQPEDHLEQIVALIRKYDAQNHIYFMTDNDAMIARARAYAPDIPCCVGWDGWAGDRDPMTMVDRALALGAKKVQLVKPWFNEETVKRAHANGILCNVFWADDPAEAQAYLEMGIDTILTNDYLAISQVKDAFLAHR